METPSSSSSLSSTRRRQSSLSSTDQELQHLQSSNGVTTPKPRSMVDHTVTIQVDIGSDDNQQPQNQHQQQEGGLDSAGKFHVVFGLLKLLIITHFHSLYIICEVIYIISLIEVTGPVSPNRVYWYSCIVFGTLGFELLLWTNLSLVTWLAINLCLLMFALASSGLLARGSDRFLQLIQPFDDMPFSEVQLDF